MSSRLVYPSVYSTMRAESESFRVALGHTVKAAVGGCLLVLLFNALGLLTGSAVARDIVHHTEDHYKSTPALTLAVALLIMVLVQTGFTWILSGRLNRLVVRVLVLTLECLAHAFATGIGVLAVVWPTTGHAVDVVTGRPGSLLSVAASGLIVLATAWCGYAVCELADRGVAIEAKTDRWLALIAATMLAGVVFVLLRQ